MPVSSDRSDRLNRALLSLEGLSVGDAFGQRFFGSIYGLKLFTGERVLPEAPWRYTDDTQMALSIVAILQQYDGIDQDRLAQHFGRHCDSSRGYGPAMHHLLSHIGRGAGWQQAARALFGG